MLPRTCLLPLLRRNNTWLTFLFCPSRPFFSLYVVEQLQTAHRPAVVSPLSVCRSAGGVWESGENADYTGEEEDLSLKSTKSGSSHRLPEEARSTKAPTDALVLSSRKKEKNHFTCLNPSTAFFSTLPASFDGRSELFFYFFATRQEERIFLTPTNFSSPHDAQPNVTEAVITSGMLSKTTRGRRKEIAMAEM